MSLRIIGIRVEKTQAVVRAWGYIGGVKCYDESDCCPEIPPPVGGDTCCFDSEPEAVVAFQVAGPLLADCGDCTMGGALDYTGTGGQLVWGADEDDFGCLVAFLAPKLYCVNGEWRFAGTLTPPGVPGFFFDVPLTVDPTTGVLVGTIIRPGCEDPIIVAVDPPCAGAVSWNCNEGICEAIAGDGGTYATEVACLAACGASFNCTSGECVEVVGTGGTYPDILACIAACGTTACNVCPTLANGRTLTAAVSGGCSCASSVVLTSNTFVFTGNIMCGGDNVPMTLGCQIDGGLRKWTVSFTTTGGFTGGSGILVTGVDCAAVSTTVDVVCGGVPTTLTVAFDDYFFCTNPPC